MNTLSFSHQIQTLRPSLKGLTYFIFDVWELALSEDLFKQLTKHPLIYTVSSGELNQSSISDHTNFLWNHDLPAVELPSAEKLRGSFAALVKLTYQDKVLLFHDPIKSQIKPFGGAYLIEPNASMITRQLLTLESSASLDLRFTAAPKNFPKIVHWFNQKRERELTPLRELKEELTEENSILSPEEWDILESQLLSP